MVEIVDFNVSHVADYVPPPNIITVAKTELTADQFERFCRRISPLIGAAYVQFITEERHVAGLRAAT